MDAVAARRTPAGSPVAHGMHAVIWALESIGSSGLVPHSVAALDARFLKFIYVDSEATLTVRRASESYLEAEISADGLVAIVLKLTLGTVSPLSGPSDAPLVEIPIQPLNLDLAAVADRRGLMPNTGAETWSLAFPVAARIVGTAQIEELAHLSTLVGMICPGLQSIFSTVNLTFGTAIDRSQGLSFHVQSVDDRFRLVEIAVAGTGLIGSISAFSRPAPVAQSGASLRLARVGPREFASTTALIIGGSRGLGAMSARIIAQGGGRVIATFLNGALEAEELRAEIGSEACRVLRYDAREEPASQLGELPWNITQLYYFATTQIFRQKASLFDSSRFREFCKIYVDGFSAISTAIQSLGASDLRAFYPSSVAVEESSRQLTEYRMAKAAGELLCADMNMYATGIRVWVRRLPRILTDQTATVIPVESADALDVMLPIIREMHT